MLRRVQKHYGHKYLFETGTYQGETAYRLQKNFEHIYTVEVFPPLYASAQRRLAQYSNITCILGTGHEAIRQIVPTLEKAAIFWLDSHYSDLAPA
jgi:protein-L-isoaspartate O-methyltransferase